MFRCLESQGSNWAESGSRVHLGNYNTCCLSGLSALGEGGRVPASTYQIIASFHRFSCLYGKVLISFVWVTEALWSFVVSPYLPGPSVWWWWSLFAWGWHSPPCAIENLLILFFLEFMNFHGNSLVKYAYSDFILQIVIQSSSPLLENCRNWKYPFPKPGHHPAGVG